MNITRLFHSTIGQVRQVYEAARSGSYSLDFRFMRCFEPKKKFLYFSVIFAWLFCSCGTERFPVRPAPPPSQPRTVVLPSSERGKLPECYEVNGDRYYPLSDAEGFVQFGKASWYGPKFQGRRTSSGQIFDMYKKTAAHKILPLFTVVKVTNLSNHKWVIVPVNDRGPFVDGREIDLSYAAAAEIDLVRVGVADVQVIALGKEVGKTEGGGRPGPVVEVEDFRTGVFTVQVGAFQNKKNALRLADRMKRYHEYVNVASYTDGDDRLWYRVTVSKSRTLDQATDILERLGKMGFLSAFIVRL
jgi:rare lipoprotein A